MKYLIIGLGNIGSEYAKTRHNIGFIIADALVADYGATFASCRYGDMASVKYKARNLFIHKPSTYMNLSGKAVQYWLNKEKIPMENLLVLVDDLALPLGTMRLRAKGGDGGHNGLISIIEHLGTNCFPRLRIGIGGDFQYGSQIDFVLGEWTEEEIKIIKPLIPRTQEVIKSFCTLGITRTMNMYNTRQDNE